jgi:lysozyme
MSRRRSSSRACRSRCACCPATPWTQGFGQTGKAIGPNNPAWSLNVARANLEGVVEECCEAIRARCSSLLPEQVAALASFLENVGGGRAGVKDGLFELKSGGPSTLWHCVITGQHQRAADQFLLWTRAQGRVLPGLVKRRRAERALYLRAA